MTFDPKVNRERRCRHVLADRGLVEFGSRHYCKKCKMEMSELGRTKWDTERRQDKRGNKKWIYP